MSDHAEPAPQQPRPRGALRLTDRIGRAVRSRSGRAIAVLAVLTAALFALRLAVHDATFDGPRASGVLRLGGVGLPASGAIWELRSVSALSAVVIGAALAASGTLLQALLRNPLAEPGILGLSSGASLGVSIAALAGYLATGAVTQYAPPILHAAIGALAALGLVYTLAQKRGLIEPVTLILTGVIVSVMAGALTLFCQQMMPDGGWAASRLWLLGSISQETTWPRLIAVAVLTLLAVACAASMGRALDAASLGDDEARAVGLRLDALRLACFTLAGLLTAGAIVLAGPIAFVGLVAPHAARRFAGASHGGLIVAASFTGAALLLAAEVLVTLVSLPSGRLPVGVLTALVGGPAFIVLLRRDAWGTGARS